MGQQMAGSMGASQATPPAVPASPVSPQPATTGGVPELMSPADAARVLGVSEADVLSALGEGSLKGKKIGSSWRIVRSALDEFLKG